jgi:hypothetical protein
VVIIFNWIGAGMAVLALVVLAVTNNGYFAALVRLLADIPYRLKFREKRDSLLAGLLAPHSGGHLFFIPCWLVGILLPIVDKLLSRPPAAP